MKEGKCTGCTTDEEDGHSQDGNGSLGKDFGNASEGLSLDPVIRDTLMKRAEAEAAQWQMDEDTASARAFKDKQAVNKKKPFPSSLALPSPKNILGANPRLQDTISEPKQPDDQEEVMKIVADQASLAVAEYLNAKEDLQNQETPDTANNHLMQLVMEINEAAKMGKFATNHARGSSSSKENAESNCDNSNGNTNHTMDSAMKTLTAGNVARMSNTPQSHQLSFFQKGKTCAANMPAKGSATAQIMLKENELFKQEEHRNSASYNMDLLQMATEINEAAKMEKFETAADSGNDPNRQCAELAVQPESIPQRQPQSSRPGAYKGVPGEALQRANTLRFSLVGAGATGQGEPLVQIPDNASALAEPHDAGLPSVDTNHNIPSRNDTQLAVANLVLEDPEEEQTRPAADPVDLQHVQQREQKRKKQRLTFILFFVMLIIVAAVIVGAVAGTQKKEPAVVVFLSTDAPTVYGSITPSEAPSSAPTGSLDILLDSLPDYTLASINNGSETPQWKAWQWLVNHQNITNLPEWRKMQLFAMSTFFYSFEGENWWRPVRDRWMDDTKEECLWFSRGFGFFVDGKFDEFGPPFGILPCDNQGKLTSLNLGNLELEGFLPAVPPEISLLTSLTHLTLLFFGAQMTIADLFPSEFYSMTDLELINIGPTLTGALPTQLGSMTGLLDINVFDCLVTGPIPSELGLLTSMTTMRLNNPYLSGTIPSELWLMTSLKFLLLGYESEMHEQWSLLRGQFPSEVGLLTELTFLAMFNTMMTGSLPSEIALATNLDVLSLTNVSLTQLTGPLPSELGLLTSLEYLELYQNQISGVIPSELGLLTSLHFLHLGDNQLTGPFLSELGKLTGLAMLVLDQNQFTGQVPSELGRLTDLRALTFNENRLMGTISSELGLLTSLGGLRIYHNQFTGPIPTEIGLMTSLTFLGLHNNDLTGALPSQLNASMGLRLYGNRFSGTVPEHLCALLRCDCSLNETPPVSTCADLTESPPDWPGRFPTRGADVMINIQTDDFPDELSWVWQKGTNVTGGWDTLESGGPLEIKNYLYSSLFPVNTDTAYRLVVSDSFGDGVYIPAWITLTATNETVLYSLVAGEAFSEITIDILVGADGSLDITNSTTL
ncbi:expressed unknown protein [Seminavis robusta]|uniref:L domain-like protein n=1 Tax=Seminavis robusta TaxID=568900 RepID=A0A9N8E2V2_9STRA|nr:expressed unknown protein [Seminavis robusta]|eukprot:Sro593_g172321.1  (1118) ;mRNA; r:36312-39665